jgi:hypothetical protein
VVWIKIEHWTQDKPEVFVMADSLGIDPDAVLGKLVRIWVWADQQTIDGNAGSVTLSLLDRLSGVTGFAKAMLGAGWLRQVGDGVQFVNFDRHNGETAKKRALTARRVDKHRAGNAKKPQTGAGCNAGSVTKALPEESREEKSESIYGEPQKPETQTPKAIPQTLTDVVIPKALRSPECQEAIAKWMQYLEQIGCDYKRPDESAISLQEWYMQMARMGAEKFCQAVSLSIAGKHQTVKPSLVDHPQDRPHKQPMSNADWMQALAVCRRYPSGSQQDSEERKIQMTPEQLQAARAVGFGRIAGSTSYDVKQIEAEFTHAIKGAKS